jgi:TPR repeat protein
MSNIGELYARAQGVPKNCVTARQWIEKAITAGYEHAKQNLRSGFEGQCQW